MIDFWKTAHTDESAKHSHTRSWASVFGLFGLLLLCLFGVFGRGSLGDAGRFLVNAMLILCGASQGKSAMVAGAKAYREKGQGGEKKT